ncbi:MULTISPECIES: pilus assembly protein [Burkholderia]|uniref:Pilus assembly protein n=1 Tax=Burkholderia contaminans TaxID=488447 RepID=A0A2S5E434_9BURK|nr:MULTISPECIES: pilus assembly protein [Burkholderia]EKS9798740.1 pilus assembly protein [Burkholderia cepacia]EKS9803168.1 pilus assembly protein [Burkholderia cepacia]EKS9810652.1 pilus assembly protein [Burkholderia cepacia]EKS9819617.1 pilus assembly protein [Burkholderia cepacia]EKS9827235.1 pilus assembly protein [Burkholderia cepacia]
MNFKLKTLVPTAIALLCATAQPAQAEGELMVMPAATRVYSNHDQKVTLRNMGDAPLYLSVSLQKVMNPGMTPEQKVDLGQVDSPGVIASPDKLTLGPGQSRQVDLKSLMEPAHEELYRLYVVPVRSLKVDDAPQDKITAPMSVAIGYGVLVRHLPPGIKLHSGWTHRCENGGITLESTGNVREIFSDVSYEGVKQPQTVAVFPGVPQHFATKRMTLQVDDERKTLECS